MKMTRTLLISALILLGLPVNPALAQVSNAVVVASCGTPPATYSAGANRQITQDTNGNLCFNGTSGGTTITGSLPAGSNIIGSNLGRTSRVSVTPTVTASTYTAGYVVGGILHFVNVFGTAGSGIVQSVQAQFTGSAQTAEIDLYVFKANPAAGTYADHAAPTWNATDAASLIDVIPLTSTKSGLGTQTIYALDGLGAAMNAGGTDLWVVPVAPSGLAAVSGATTFSVALTTLQD